MSGAVTLAQRFNAGEGVNGTTCRGSDAWIARLSFNRRCRDDRSYRAFISRRWNAGL